ncbi:hypothetical protein D3C76_184160 [compost metagenome]|jgi:hypothetical protein
MLISRDFLQFLETYSELDRGRSFFMDFIATSSSVADLGVVEWDKMPEKEWVRNGSVAA